MLPFAVVAPILGPALDYRRSGRRVLVLVSMLGRAVLALMMARWISDPAPKGLLVYPLAFAHPRARQGLLRGEERLVPALRRRPEQLGEGQLAPALVSVIATTVGGGPAFLVQEIFGPEERCGSRPWCSWSAGSWRRRFRASASSSRAKKHNSSGRSLHQPSIPLAGSAMAMMRGAVGFLALAAFC